MAFASQFATILCCPRCGAPIPIVEAHRNSCAFCSEEVDSPSSVALPVGRALELPKRAAREVSALAKRRAALVRLDRNNRIVAAVLLVFMVAGGVTLIVDRITTGEGRLLELMGLDLTVVGALGALFAATIREARRARAREQEWAALPLAKMAFDSHWVALCPECGGELRKASDRIVENCSYCGSSFVLPAALLEPQILAQHEHVRLLRAGTRSAGVMYANLHMGPMQRSALAIACMVGGAIFGAIVAYRASQSECVDFDSCGGQALIISLLLFGSGFLGYHFWTRVTKARYEGDA